MGIATWAYFCMPVESCVNYFFILVQLYKRMSGYVLYLYERISVIEYRYVSLFPYTGVVE